jgi:hypothetical protein
MKNFRPSQFQVFRTSGAHYISLAELHNTIYAAVQSCTPEVLTVCTDIQNTNSAGVHTCNSARLNSCGNASIPY